MSGSSDGNFPGRRRVSLVVPFYDEERNVSAVVSGLLSAFRGSAWDLELVCVQNGSTDGTAVALEGLAKGNPEVKVVEVPLNRGYGHGIRKGLAVGTGDIVGYVDGDGQIAPADALRVLDGIACGDAVKGMRVDRQDGPKRRFVSSCFNRLFRVIFGVVSVDINAKPKFFERRLLSRLDPVSDGWFLDAEIMLKSTQLGVAWKEVPATFLRRKAGSSSVRLSTILEFVSNILAWRFGRRLSIWRTSLSK